MGVAASGRLRPYRFVNLALVHLGNRFQSSRVGWEVNFNTAGRTHYVA
jgi:hypothetical protein